VIGARTEHVVLLPGAVLPASAAYPALLSQLGAQVDARPKELELYARGAPAAHWSLIPSRRLLGRRRDRAGAGG